MFFVAMMERCLVRVFFFSKLCVCLSENLSASELKKLKNKQRKKAKQEALKREKQKQEEQKKEQTKKTQDAEVDGPKEEELLPEKLVKVCFFILNFSQRFSKFEVNDIQLLLFYNCI